MIIKLTSLEVSTQEIEEAKTLISEDLKQAIQLAASNIEKFHAEQPEEIKVIETTRGVNCKISHIKYWNYILGRNSSVISRRNLRNSC